jgi:hypothetical protein
MAFIKFSSFLFLLNFGLANAEVRFSPKSCLDSNYKMTMIQKGALFGLLKHEFTISKNGCIVSVTHNKYLPKEWIVDVCREPVHIKVSSATGIDVAKKTDECTKKDNSRATGDFCSQYFHLMDVIQDDGLIFAEGDRDDLSSNHGKTYCSYLLIKRYLNDSIVFSRYSEVPDIFLETKSSAPPVEQLEPAKEKKKKSKPQVSVDADGPVTSTF